MVKIIFYTWLWIHCQLTGPGVPNEFDLDSDGAFDMLDVAEIQNGMVVDYDGIKVGFEMCCCGQECSWQLCRELFP